MPQHRRKPLVNRSVFGLDFSTIPDFREGANLERMLRQGITGLPLKPGFERNANPVLGSILPPAGVNTQIGTQKEPGVDELEDGVGTQKDKVPKTGLKDFFNKQDKGLLLQRAVQVGFPVARLLAQNKKIKDLDWSAFNHTYSSANVRQV